MVLQTKRDTTVERIIPAIAVMQSKNQGGLSKKTDAISLTAHNRASGSSNAQIVHFIAEIFAGSLRSRYCIQTRVNAEYAAK